MGLKIRYKGEYDIELSFNVERGTSIRKSQYIIGGFVEKFCYFDYCRGGRFRFAELPFGDRRLAYIQHFRQLHLTQTAGCTQFAQTIFEFHDSIIEQSSRKILDKSYKT